MLRCLRLAIYAAATLALISLTGCTTYDSTTTDGNPGDTPPSEMATELYTESDIGIDQPQP